MSEQRLIDANRIIDFIDCGHLRNPLELCFSESEVVNMLEQAPTVPAEVVCHCGECKHGHPAEHAFEGDGVTPLICCGYMTEPNRPREYCSWGERRESEAT